MGKYTIPYKPRPLQRDLHNNMARFSVVVCHRRFGKTVMAVNKLIKDLIHAKQEGLPRPRGIYVAPLFRQAKQVAWDYAKFYLSNMPGYKPNESELRIDFFDDCRIFLIGADNPDSVRGIYADSVVLDEYAQMNPKMWSEVLRPALTDRKGKALFIGTPKGKNEFYKMFKEASDPTNVDWNAFVFRASQTGYVDEQELTAARRDMSAEEFAQEYECSWEAAIKGAYYGRTMERITDQGHITRVPHDPALPVYTSWDLGLDDATAIWFYQKSRTEIRVINYYENTGAALDHYVKKLFEYRDKLGYTFDKHYLPHDVKVKELSTGRSRLELLRSMGLSVNVVQNIPIDDGINAVRSLLPRCWFDAENCDRGIEALRQYRVAFNDKTQTPMQRPLHDWTSHPADAFRYLAVSLSENDDSPRQTRALSEYNIFNPFGRGKQQEAEGTKWLPW
jgi:hypothetical protein